MKKRIILHNSILAENVAFTQANQQRMEKHKRRPVGLDMGIQGCPWILLTVPVLPLLGEGGTTILNGWGVGHGLQISRRDPVPKRETEDR
jgi:hypothetical protein